MEGFCKVVISILKGTNYSCKEHCGFACLQRLYVVQKDTTESAACLITPPHVK